MLHPKLKTIGKKFCQKILHQKIPNKKAPLTPRSAAAAPRRAPPRSRSSPGDGNALGNLPPPARFPGEAYVAPLVELPSRRRRRLARRASPSPSACLTVPPWRWPAASSRCAARLGPKLTGASPPDSDKSEKKGKEKTKGKGILGRRITWVWAHHVGPSCKRSKSVDREFGCDRVTKNQHWDYALVQRVILVPYVPRVASRVHDVHARPTHQTGELASYFAIQGAYITSERCINYVSIKPIKSKLVSTF